MILPDLQLRLIFKNLPSGVSIGTSGSDFFGGISGFEEVRLCVYEYFCEDLGFEAVGSCGCVNKEESLPFGAVPEEEGDDKTAEEESGVLNTIWILGREL